MSLILLRTAKRTPKFLFRSLVRKVIANLEWLLEDVRVGVKKTQKSVITLQHIRILHKPPEERTAEENQTIYKIIGGFKSFRKYPDRVKLLLVGYCRFCYYGADRIIVRKGQTAYDIYFIMSGEAAIITEKFDEFLEETELEETSVLTAGDVFGEVAFLHHIPRLVTVKTKTGVEFLTLSLEDFTVLESTVREDWDNSAALLQKFEYFDKWDKIRIGEICMQSIIKKFRKDDTVLGDGHGRKNYVHFVVEGSCSLIEHFHLRRTQTKLGDVRYTRYSNESLSASLVESEGKQSKLSQLPKSPAESVIQDDDEGSEEGSATRMARRSIFGQSVSDPIVPHHSKHAFRKSSELSEDVATVTSETVFMKIAIFMEKACFSLGEPMVNRRIVAEEPLTCLLLPAYLLVDQDNIWMRIKQFLTKRIPTTEVVYHEMLKQRKWRKYKSNIVEPLWRSFCTNWYSNIPYSLRIRDDYAYAERQRNEASLHQV